MYDNCGSEREREWKEEKKLLVSRSPAFTTRKKILFYSHMKMDNAVSYLAYILSRGCVGESIY